MRNHFFLLAFTLLVLSCNDKKNETITYYKFWDINKFHIVDSALKDEEQIKILYSSSQPENYKKFLYYIHLIVVSQKTGDTVNILTTTDNALTSKDGNKVYAYFDQNNVITKLQQININKLTESDSSELNNEIKNQNNNKEKVTEKISKVARDPKYDSLADNKYPTVIGSIGEVK